MDFAKVISDEVSHPITLLNFGTIMTCQNHLGKLRFGQLTPSTLRDKKVANYF
jgi:hypothetical protein